MVVDFGEEVAVRFVVVVGTVDGGLDGAQEGGVFLVVGVAEGVGSVLDVAESAEAIPVVLQGVDGFI